MTMQFSLHAGFEGSTPRREFRLNFSCYFQTAPAVSVPRQHAANAYCSRDFPSYMIHAKEKKNLPNPLLPFATARTVHPQRAGTFGMMINIRHILLIAKEESSPASLKSIHA